ncbi:pancreatic lipase-related protein 2-like isoform X3 [Haemaphysalis longicornis]
MLVTGSCIALLLTLHCESYVLEETQSTVSDDPPATVKGRIGPQKGKDKTDEQVCFQDVGCFSRRDKLTLPSQFPSDPKFFPPRFLLYDRSVKYLPKTIWLRLNDSFKFRRQFAQKKPLFVVVHGWLESAFVPWAQAIKDALLEQADCNVLVVDWSGLAATTYNNGAANTAAVGRELALVIQRLFKMFPGTLNPTLVHAIGYSFGAQVSGFFGRNLRRSTRALIARITALDPAGPLFNNTDVSVSSEDAAFVDVIHTSGGYPNQPWQLGLFRPVGHVDFYPNGAKNQPGCLGSTSTSHGLILTAADAVPQERKSHLKPESTDNLLLLHKNMYISAAAALSRSRSYAAFHVTGRTVRPHASSGIVPRVSGEQGMPPRVPTVPRRVRGFLEELLRRPSGRWCQQRRNGLLQPTGSRPGYSTHLHERRPPRILLH